MILIHQVEVEKEHGRHPWDAVVEATTHRFRPILLTAAAAILGMIPITPTIFWGPMAYSIMGGLAVATLLTLVFLPALYVAWFRIRMPHHELPGLEQSDASGLPKSPQPSSPSASGPGELPVSTYSAEAADQCAVIEPKVSHSIS